MAVKRFFNNESVTFKTTNDIALGCLDYVKCNKVIHNYVKCYSFDRTKITEEDIYSVVNLAITKVCNKFLEDKNFFKSDFHIVNSFNVSFKREMIDMYTSTKAAKRGSQNSEIYTDKIEKLRDLSSIHHDQGNIEVDSHDFEKSLKNLLEMLDDTASSTYPDPRGLFLSILTKKRGGSDLKQITDNQQKFLKYLKRIKSVSSDLDVALRDFLFNDKADVATDESYSPGYEVYYVYAKERFKDGVRVGVGIHYALTCLKSNEVLRFRHDYIGSYSDSELKTMVKGAVSQKIRDLSKNISSNKKALSEGLSVTALKKVA